MRTYSIRKYEVLVGGRYFLKTRYIFSARNLEIAKEIAEDVCRRDIGDSKMVWFHDKDYGQKCYTFRYAGIFAILVDGPDSEIPDPHEVLYPNEKTWGETYKPEPIRLNT